MLDLRQPGKFGNHIKTNSGTTLSFAPVAGLRWFGVTTRLENRTTSLAVEHQNSWIALQGGLEMECRWEMDAVTSLVESMGISGQALVGSMFGGDGGSMWTVQAGISLYCTPSTALFFWISITRTKRRGRQLHV